MLSSRGANVCSAPVEVPAVARARWLAEVADALNQAERLLKQLTVTGLDNATKADLELRIGAAKYELELLRTSRQPREESGSRWIDFPPWKQPERSGI